MEVYNELQKIIINGITGGFGGVVISWIFNNIFKERLKQKIKSEYEKELKSFQATIDLQINDIEHRHQIHQLKTSLFFDHQRQAFSEILEQISIVLNEWDKLFDPEDFFYDSVPKTELDKYNNLVFKHQLFFDDECSMFLAQANEAMTDSIPFNRDQEFNHETREQLYRLHYIHERLIFIFQEKLGYSTAYSHKKDLALLGLLQTINILSKPNGFPKELSIKKRKDDAEDIVRIGYKNIELLKNYSKVYSEILAKDNHNKVWTSLIYKYLKIIENIPEL